MIVVLLILCLIAGFILGMVAHPKIRKQVATAPKPISPVQSIGEHSLVNIAYIPSSSSHYESWKYICSCGTYEYANINGKRTETEALELFKAHQKLWVDYIDSERAAMNKSIAQNAKELEELTSLSDGFLGLRNTLSKSNAGRA